MWGFQLWVNLPGAEKMKEPRYQDIDAREIPEIRTENGTLVRVIAGTALGTEGAVRGVAVKPLYLDISIPAGEHFEQVITADHHAFVYVFEGSTEFGHNQTETIARGELGVLSPGNVIQASNKGDGPARFLLVTGNRSVNRSSSMARS